jgi:hypothetical protein
MTSALLFGNALLFALATQIAAVSTAQQHHYGSPQPGFILAKREPHPRSKK